MSSDLDKSLIELINQASQYYEKLWGQPAKYCAYSAGRVNLIGDHTDYNDGLVFPMAIPAYTVIVGSESADGECTLETMQQEVNQKVAKFSLVDIRPSEPVWANYFKGVLNFFPSKSRAFKTVVNSSVPLGSGLSSSAALEVATFLFLEALNGDTGLSLGEKAQICQKAEHVFANTPCGIMDQLISISGKADNAVLIDCRSLDTELVPLNLSDYTFIVTNSNVKHNLATSEYSQRRKSCEQVATLLGKSSLRDVSMRELETSRPVLTEELYRTARHVVTEIERTADAAEALKRNDLSVFGTLMSQSHLSLRDDYRVSCPEVDELVEIALASDGVLGSRITGGGFGGCIVTLVRENASEQLKRTFEEKYSGTTTSYQFKPANGGRIVQLPLK